MIKCFFSLVNGGGGDDIDGLLGAKCVSLFGWIIRSLTFACWIVRLLGPDYELGIRRALCSEKACIHFWPNMNTLDRKLCVIFNIFCSFCLFI